MSQRLDLVDAYASRQFPTLLAAAAEADSFEDWPWILLFRELDEAFPESRFILTVREPDRWLRSYRNMLCKQGPANAKINSIRSILYDLDFPEVTDGALLTRYRKHNSDVLKHFAGRPESLLVVNWENGDGWAQISQFLQTDCPTMELPHENRGNYAPLDQRNP
jgi:hypothetical protein